MKVKEFADIIAVGKVIGKDVGRQFISLSDRRISVLGIHCEAVRSLSKRARLPIETPVQVDYARLNGVLALMSPDAELAISLSKSGRITLRGGRTRSTLQALRSSNTALVDMRDWRGFDAETERFDAKELRQALAFLRECTKGGGIADPILGGVLIVAQKGVAQLYATDRSTRLGNVAIKLPLRTEGAMFPVEDAIVALDQLRSSVSIQFSRESMYLYDGKSAIKIALLNGEFPNVTHLTGRNPKYAYDLNTRAVDTAVRAAKLIDRYRMLRFVIDNERASFQVDERGAENYGNTTSFKIAAGTETARRLRNVSITLNADAIAPLSAMGERVRIYYDDARSPLRFVGKYKLWTSPLLTS